MRVFSESPTLPNLRFLCLKCGTDWAATPAEYTISRSCTNPEEYEGTFEGSFDADNSTTLTSCRCPVCSQKAYHGTVYDDDMEEETESQEEETEPEYIDASIDSPEGSSDDIGQDYNTVPTVSVQLSFDVTAGDSFTYSDSSITSDMVVAAVSIPDGVRSGAWSVRTSNGSLTITGTIAAAGTVTMVLTQASVQEITWDDDSYISRGDDDTDDETFETDEEVITTDGDS